MGRMRNKLVFSVDDNEARMIIQSLNKEAIRLQNATSALYYNLADRIDEQVFEYQSECEAVLAELHGIAD